MNAVGLGLGLLIMLCYGVAGYFGALGSEYGVRLLSLATMLAEFALFGLAALAFSTNLTIPASTTVLASLKGLFIAVGFVIESQLFRRAIEIPAQSLSGLNLVNVLSNGDAIFIMLASIFLNSYTAFGLLGLLLVYIGATVILD